MVAFFLVIIVAAAVLAIFALMPSREGSDNAKKQETKSLDSYFVRNELTLKLEEQINSLNVELESLKTGHQQVGAELALANELVVNLKDELVRVRKSDKTVEYGELEKLRNENTRLRDELYKKGQELEKSLSDNLSLSKDASKNQASAAKLELLEKQIADYNNKIEEYKVLINKLEESGKEAALKSEVFKIEKSDFENKIKMLESQIKEYNKEIEKQNEIISQMEGYNKELKKDESAGGVSKEKYEELKNKLEKAEEVLRMVHGAGA